MYINHGPISTGNITLFYPDPIIPTPTPEP